MKINILLILFIVGGNFIHAQKHDNNWVFSMVNENVEPWGSSVMSFDAVGKKFLPIDSEITISLTGTSMSDKGGDLIFYTNGLQIADKNGNVMENGEGLNPGFGEEDEFGYSQIQGIFSLPSPKNEEEYYLFHLNRDHVNGYFGIEPLEVLYTKIDMSANNGLGKVVEKNVNILGSETPPFDTLIENFSAARHGNGRDWWIIVPSMVSNEIYSFQLTPEGIVNKNSQPANIIPDTSNSTVWLSIEEPFIIGGQNIFSPDGNTYVLKDLWGYIHFFDFDRCSGLLSNQRTIETKFYHPRGDNPTSAISPSSRYYYYYYEYPYILQIDLWEDKLEKGIDTVGVYDKYKSGFLNPPAFMQLGPDGRIYIRPGNGTLNMHTIDAPDLKGIDCQYMSHQIQLPNYTGFHIPYYPNYRLYDLHESPCDTLGIDGPR